MTLRPPVLDRRGFDDLVQDAKERLIQRFPDYSDHGPADPGMALVDLFAWYTETLLHQMEQLPVRHYFAFLDLLGMKPQPPQPARAAIQFAFSGEPVPGGAPPVPAGSSSSNLTAADGSRVGFQTTRSLGVVTRPLVRIERRLPASADSVRKVDHDIPLALNAPDGSGFWPFGPLGRIGSRFYLGFGAEAFDTPEMVFPETVSFFVRRLEDRCRRPQIAAIRADDAQGLTDDANGLANDAKRLHERRVFDAPEIIAFGVVDERTREPLAVLADSSARGFDRNGYIHLSGPRRVLPRLSPDSSRASDGAIPCFWIGFEVGNASFPFEKAPAIKLLVNAVEAVALETVEFREIGTSNGLRDQEFVLRDPPIDPNSLDLVAVQDPGPSGDLQPLAERAEAWKVAHDFAAADADERSDRRLSGAPKRAEPKPVVVVDAATGRLRFGDGKSAKIPPAGQRLIARRYRRGGGAATNVAAETIRFKLGDRLLGTNPFRATGGTDAEPVEDVAERAPRRLRDRERLVTPGDAESIACDLGGMARAKAERGAHPDYPGTRLPGALTVCVAPAIVARRPHPPYPTREAFDHVVRVLEERRLVGQELFVRPAAVVPVRVCAKIEVEWGIPASDVEAATIARLDEFINTPERGFGGWLHPLRLSGELQAVDGIRRVLRLAYRLGVHGEIVDAGRLPPDETDDPAKAIPEIDPYAIFWSAPDHDIKAQEVVP